MTGKELERLNDIPEVAEKLGLGRRRFLKRIAIAASLGVLGVHREKAEACPCPCDQGCDSCNIHTCGVDTCVADVCARNICTSDLCTSTDKCGTDKCLSADLCISDTCAANTCSINTCSTNVCLIDKCGSDTCIVDDSCVLMNKCTTLDTDCGWGDVSCYPVINSCDVD